MSGMPSTFSRIWFRLYAEAVDDEKLRLLAFEDRWHFVALLCCKAKGILDDPDAKLMRRKVAVKLGLDLSAMEEMARRLAEVGLIDSETLQPLAWDRRQYVSDYDPTRNERKKRYREKQKNDGTHEERTGNARGTHEERPPEAEAEADTEAETEAEADTENAGLNKEKRGEERVLARQRANATAAHTPKPTAALSKAWPECPDWLPAEIWQGFIEHRKAKRKPLTPYAAELTLRDLDKARGFGHDPVALIEAAIVHGWTGCVFGDKHFVEVVPANATPDINLLSRQGEQQRRNLDSWLHNPAEVPVNELH